MLDLVVNRLEEIGGFAPADWSDRTVVKVAGTGKAAPAFLQALTGHEWVLTLRFLVKRGDFKVETLANQLNLRPFYESARPVLSIAERLTIAPARIGTEEVFITVHSLSDLTTEAFDAFLVKAAVSYQKTFGDAGSRTISPEILADAAAIAAEGLPPGWRVVTAETQLTPKAKPKPKRKTKPL